MDELRSRPVATEATYYERVTYTRRLLGDNILEGILVGVTLVIGWLIWFAIVAPRGQTPAKQLIGVIILDDATGKVASTGAVWMREIVGKIAPAVVLALIGVIFIGGQNGSNLSSLYTLIGGISILADANDRAIWDRLAGTRVARIVTRVVAASAGDRLEELDRLREGGEITDVEYMRRRREIIDNS